MNREPFLVLELDDAELQRCAVAVGRTPDEVRRLLTDIAESERWQRDRGQILVDEMRRLVEKTPKLITRTKSPMTYTGNRHERRAAVAQAKHARK